VKGHVHEGFDPLLVSRDVIDDHLYKLLDITLDFDDKKDAEQKYLSDIKVALEDFIGEWVDEMQDGFEDGMTDVVRFFKDNSQHAMQGGELEMMMTMMGTETIMKYISGAYQSYKNRREEKKRRASHPPTAQRGDEEMKDEEEEEKKESQREHLREKLQARIDADKEKMAAAAKQRPLSEAYLSVCPFSVKATKQELYGASEEARNQFLNQGARKTKDQALKD